MWVYLKISRMLLSPSLPSKWSTSFWNRVRFLLDSLKWNSYSDESNVAAKKEANVLLSDTPSSSERRVRRYVYNDYTV